MKFQQCNQVIPFHLVELSDEHGLLVLLHLSHSCTFQGRRQHSPQRWQKYCQGRKTQLKNNIFESIKNYPNFLKYIIGQFQLKMISKVFFVLFRSMLQADVYFDQLSDAMSFLNLVKMPFLDLFRLVLLIFRCFLLLLVKL